MIRPRSWLVSNPPRGTDRRRDAFSLRGFGVSWAINTTASIDRQATTSTSPDTMAAHDPHTLLTKLCNSVFNPERDKSGLNQVAACMTVSRVKATNESKQHAAPAHMIRLPCACESISQGGGYKPYLVGLGLALGSVTVNEGSTRPPVPITGKSHIYRKPHNQKGTWKAINVCGAFAPRAVTDMQKIICLQCKKEESQK